MNPSEMQFYRYLIGRRGIRDGWNMCNVAIKPIFHGLNVKTIEKWKIWCVTIDSVLSEGFWRHETSTITYAQLIISCAATELWLKHSTIFFVALVRRYDCCHQCVAAAGWRDSPEQSQLAVVHAVANDIQWGLPVRQRAGQRSTGIVPAAKSGPMRQNLFELVVARIEGRHHPVPPSYHRRFAARGSAPCRNLPRVCDQAQGKRLGTVLESAESHGRLRREYVVAHSGQIGLLGPWADAKGRFALLLAVAQGSTHHQGAYVRIMAAFSV